MFDQLVGWQEMFLFLQPVLESSFSFVDPLKCNSIATTISRKDTCRELKNIELLEEISLFIEFGLHLVQIEN